MAACALQTLSLRHGGYMALSSIQSSIEHPGIHHREYDRQETMFEESPDVQHSYEAFETSDPTLESVPAVDREPESAVLHSNPLKIKAQDSTSEFATILTVDDFAALEERVLRAVDLVRRERQARSAAEQRVAALELQLKEAQSQASNTGQLQQEVETLRAEREQVRTRIDRLLGQLDALEL